jgi:hypothetical protein
MERSEPAPLVVTVAGGGFEVVVVELEKGTVVTGAEDLGADAVADADTDTEADAEADVEEAFPEELTDDTEDVADEAAVVAVVDACDAVVDGGGAVVELEEPGAGGAEEEVEVKGKGTTEPPCGVLINCDEEVKAAAALYSSMDWPEGGLITPAMPAWQWPGVPQ